MSNALAEQYTGIAKSLHWLIALLLTGLLALGFYMHDLPLSPQKLQFYSWHKWAGVSTFLLVMVRLAWRLTHQPPALPWHMSRVQQLAAHAGHLGLYVLMMVIPLSGWLMSSAKGYQTVWFGILPIPDLLVKDKALADVLAVVHMSLNWILVTMVLIHIAAALKHHFIDKDDILHRMLPKIFSARNQFNLPEQ
jgi:cytochrome b561